MYRAFIIYSFQASRGRIEEMQKSEEREERELWSPGELSSLNRPQRFQSLADRLSVIDLDLLKGAVANDIKLVNVRWKRLGSCFSSFEVAWWGASSSACPITWSLAPQLHNSIQSTTPYFKSN